MTAAHKTAEQHTIALALVREIRAASDWTHPARIGLGRLMDRAHAMQITATDMQELVSMHKAVTAHIVCAQCGCRMEMTASGLSCWNCYINNNR